MKTLNDSGLKKLVEYINHEYGKKFIINNSLIELDDESISIIEDLKKHNIVLKEFSADKYTVSIVSEDVPAPTIPTPTATPVEASAGEDDIKKIQEIIKQLMPHLTKLFPTKEEVNTALNDLRTQLIDPEKLTEIFKNMSTDLKKTQTK